MNVARDFSKGPFSYFITDTKEDSIKLFYEEDLLLLALGHSMKEKVIKYSI